MKQMISFFAIIIVLPLSFATTIMAAPADFDFYKGKLVTYIVATKPGGGYDSYARTIGKYMQKYIPGATVIVKNVPGAGHIIGANETYLAKPDGLTIGTFNTGLIYSQIVGQEGIRFNLSKYSWIGKANSETRVLIVGLKSPYRTLKDVMESKEPLKLPTAGVGTQDYNEMVIMSAALPVKFQPVPGYAGREGEMAILRGEVSGCLGSYVGLQGLIATKECRILMQYGNQQRIPGLEKVPHINSINVAPKMKSMITLINSIVSIGRLTAAPPGVPPGRLQVLREAYKKALADPELINYAEKLQLDFDPSYGDDVQKMVTESVNQPAENLKMLREIIKLP